MRRAVPWLGNVTLYGCLFAGGDFLHQCVTHWDTRELDLKRTRNVALVAFCFHGNFNYFWQRALERRFPGKSVGMIARKLVLDQSFASPLATSVFYTGVSALEGKEDVFEDWREKFFNTYKVSVSGEPKVNSITPRPSQRRGSNQRGSAKPPDVSAPSVKIVEDVVETNHEVLQDFKKPRSYDSDSATRPRSAGTLENLARRKRPGSTKNITENHLARGGIQTLDENRILVTGLMYWPFMQFLNFLLVPLYLRTIFMGCSAFFWASFLCFSRQNGDGTVGAAVAWIMDSDKRLGANTEEK